MFSQTTVVAQDRLVPCTRLLNVIIFESFQQYCNYDTIGDVVECEIEGIGMLRNTVVDTVDNVVESPASVGEADRDTPERRENLRQGPPSQSDGLVSKQRLKDSVCVVTGGARGLGYGIALRLAAEGAKTVVLLDMKQQDVTEAASQLEKELASALGEDAPSGTFHGLACDVTDHERMKMTFDHVANIISPTGRIDILVQAAGIVGQTNLKTHEVKPSNFDAVMNVNVNGILYGCQAVIPYMLEQKVSPVDPLGTFQKFSICTNRSLRHFSTKVWPHRQHCIDCW